MGHQQLAQQPLHVNEHAPHCRLRALEWKSMSLHSCIGRFTVAMSVPTDRGWMALSVSVSLATVGVASWRCQYRPTVAGCQCHYRPWLAVSVTSDRRLSWLALSVPTDRGWLSVSLPTVGLAGWRLPCTGDWA